MRNDRLSSLRQRLKRGTFEFGALLEGVSTLEEPDARPAVPADPVEEALRDEREEIADAGPVPTADVPAAEAQPDPSAVPEAAEPPKLAPVRQETPAPIGLPAPAPSNPPLAAFTSNGALGLDKGAHDDRLRAALDSLGRRFSQEAGQFRTAAFQMDSEEAGFHLAHVNQILELLSSIDPRAETARQLGTQFAPPKGRTWPSTAWTVAELMESPLSGLLPEDADERFVREVLYASWGVTFETTPSA